MKYLFPIVSVMSTNHINFELNHFELGTRVEAFNHI